MTFLIAAAAIVAGAVLADRLACLGIAGAVSGRIAVATQPSARPVVSVGGFPFLTQLLAGRYRRVSVTLAAFTAGGVEFTALTARLAEVTAPPGQLRPRLAGSVFVTATIPLSALAGRLPPGLALRQHRGELRVVAAQLPVPVSGTLRIDAGRHAIRVIPKLLGVPSLIAFEIALPALPPQLAIESVTASDAGLLVRLHGRDVPLSGLRVTDC